MCLCILDTLVCTGSWNNNKHEGIQLIPASYSYFADLIKSEHLSSFPYSLLSSAPFGQEAHELQVYLFISNSAAGQPVVSENR